METINESRRMGRPKIVVILIALIWIISSCTDPDGTGMALVNVRLVDAPGDFDEAWIEILGVEIGQAKGRDSKEEQWTFIEYQQPNQKVDISKLVGGGVLLIGRAELPVNAISGIKLILGEDHHLVREGKDLSLSLENISARTIELETDFRLEGSYSYDIYLDFDLERSIQPSSDPSVFILSPRVRSFVLAETSSLGGRVMPPEARPVLYAIQGVDTVTTLTSAQGEYLFRGLDEGEHTLVVRPRPPYQDTLFVLEARRGELVEIDDIMVRLPEPE